MQRFTLIHDGSTQGWQAAYLAFQIAARLGAPLLGLLVDPATDWERLSRWASQVEVGGRAAELSIDIRFVTDSSLEIIIENTRGSNGLFVPRRLVPDGETAARFLEALACPLWVVSREATLGKVVMLVQDPAGDESMIAYTKSLSLRTQQSLIGFVRPDDIELARESDSLISWYSLTDFSQERILVAVADHEASLLFLPRSDLAMLEASSVNCVIFPKM